MTERDKMTADAEKIATLKKDQFERERAALDAAKSLVSTWNAAAHADREAPQ